MKIEFVERNEMEIKVVDEQEENVLRFSDLKVGELFVWTDEAQHIRRKVTADKYCILLKDLHDDRSLGVSTTDHKVKRVTSVTFTVSDKK